MVAPKINEKEYDTMKKIVEGKSYYTAVEGNSAIIGLNDNEYFFFGANHPRYNEVLAITKEAQAEKMFNELIAERDTPCAGETQYLNTLRVTFESSLIKIGIERNDVGQRVVDAVDVYYQKPEINRMFLLYIIAYAKGRDYEQYYCS